MSVTIGIDLGTTNSAVAFYDSELRVIEVEDAPSMPSVVAFDIKDDHNILVGRRAALQGPANPEFTFFNIKRLMGKPFNDDINMGPQVVEGDEGEAWLQGPGRKWSPAELSGLILETLKSAAEKALGREVTNAVITVPAYFDDKQKAATLLAGKLAGFTGDVRLLSEPNAAAIAYGLDQEKYNTIFVWDMGGGTFDATCMDIGLGFNVPRSTKGNTSLGGINFDEEIAHWFAEKYLEETGTDLTADGYRFLRLKREAEVSKVALSDKEATDVSLKFAMTDPETNTAKHITYPLARNELNSLVEHLLLSAMKSTELALREANCSVKDIDKVILVGGMTKMPLVRDTVEEFFGQKPQSKVNPDLIVTHGAAMFAASEDGRIEKIIENDIVPMPIGIEVPGGAFRTVIKAGATFGTNTSLTMTNNKGGQPLLSVGIYQGDSPVASENTFMGRLDYELKEDYPVDGAEFEVMFEVDQNGLLDVLGVDKHYDDDTHQIYKGDTS